MNVRPAFFIHLQRVPVSCALQPIQVCDKNTDKSRNFSGRLECTVRSFHSVENFRVVLRIEEARNETSECYGR